MRSAICSPGSGEASHPWAVSFGSQALGRLEFHSQKKGALRLTEDSPAAGVVSGGHETSGISKNLALSDDGRHDHGENVRLYHRIRTRCSDRSRSIHNRHRSRRDNPPSGTRGNRDATSIDGTLPCRRSMLPRRPPSVRYQTEALPASLLVAN